MSATMSATRAKIVKTKDKIKGKPDPDDTIDTEELVDLIRTHAIRHRWCERVEEEVGTRLGLKFKQRSYINDYYGSPGRYDRDRVLQLYARSPKRLAKADVIRALHAVRRGPWTGNYGISGLVDLIVERFHLDMIVFNDVHTVTYTATVTDEELFTYGWDGRAATIGQYARHYSHRDNPTVVTSPDPRRPATT